MLVRGADLTFNLPDNYVVGTPVLRRIDPRYEYWDCEQAIRTPGAAGPMMGADVSGTGAGVNPTFLSGSPGPGGGDFGPCVSVTTGTTTTGRAHWGLGNGAIVHNFNSFFELIYWRGCIAILDLSDFVDEYDVWFGFGDSVVSATPTDGAQFVYNRDGLGTNWFVQNRAGGAGSAVDTGVAVAPNQAHEFIVSWTPSGGVKYWYDGVVIANLTNNIAAPANLFGAGAGILKSAGTTARNFVVAYQEVYARWSTPRGLALPPELT
jgi:hypothetical protein